MELLIKIENLNQYSENDKIPCKCLYCKNTFYLTKNKIRRGIKGERPCNYCSLICSRKYKKENNIKYKQYKLKEQITKILVKCKNCNKEFFRYKCNIKTNTFCSTHCSGKYNSTHKTFGTNRSRLEKWIELKLSNLYPKIEILFNNRNIIGAELDIYIPSLKLAFELNGIVHYEPIYGTEKLNNTQNRDKIKFQLCLQNNIELAIIDTSSMGNLKEKKANIFLDIIINIINQKLISSLSL